jgi:hypothetical protein
VGEGHWLQTADQPWEDPVEAEEQQRVEEGPFYFPLVGDDDLQVAERGVVHMVQEKVEEGQHADHVYLLEVEAQNQLAWDLDLEDERIDLVVAVPQDLEVERLISAVVCLEEEIHNLVDGGADAEEETV